MQLKSFLLIALVGLCSAASKTYPIKGVSTNDATEGKTVLLEYTGHLSDPTHNITIGAKLTMDTSIGFRYDVTFQNANKLMSHMAFFYKFSHPYQTIVYNYLTHKSDIIKQKAGDPNNDVTVAGKENINSFPCTHLQHTSKHETQDYWMSKAVPGFSQLSQILKQIDPSLMASINETIFNWGGLVRIKMVSTSSDGQTTAMILNLIKAQTDVALEASTFEVPGK